MKYGSALDSVSCGRAEFWAHMQTHIVNHLRHLGFEATLPMLLLLPLRQMWDVYLNGS